MAESESSAWCSNLYGGRKVATFRYKSYVVDITKSNANNNF